jgi:TonB family protein
MIGRLIAFCTFLLSVTCYSQEKEVFGRIVDAETQKPLFEANVVVPGTSLGTTTNFQGFFKFSIPADSKSLIVSHIGYQRSSLEIPADNKFLLRLEKEFRILNTLHLKYYDEKDTTNQSLESEGPSSGLRAVERDAKYNGGWKRFYSDIAGVMKSDSVQEKLQDSVFHLKFSVEVDGSIKFVSLTPENTARFSTLLEKSSNFKWESATQNNTKVVQYFDLPIRSFEEEKFTVVEEVATPVGGMASFYKYIGKNLRYPKIAKRMGVEGKVFVQFVIEKDGSITNPIIFKGIGAGCDEEALRLIRESPKWNPGTQRGNPVRQRYTLPIIFKLG